MSENVRFDDWLQEKLGDPDFRREFDDLEPAYQVVRLRIMRGLTQQQLAELVGTKQASIARLESGRTKPSISFLEKVVEALGGRLTIKIEPESSASQAR